MPRSRGYSSTGPRGGSPPLGIAIICVLGGLGAIRGLLAALSVLGTGGPFVVVGLVLAGLALGKLAILYGLWTLQRWAWTWALVLYGASALVSLARFDLLGAALSVLVVGYVASKERHSR